MTNARAFHRGFTIVELLVVIAIVALLLAIMLPALAGARETARTAVCLSNQRQLASAWTGHALDNRERPVPYLEQQGPIRTYWFGEEHPGKPAIDATLGPLGPYLDAQAGDRSVFECPAQRDGTFEKQGQLTDAWTTTYGYNAYYLTPATSGYYNLLNYPEVRATAVDRPTDLFVFGDSMIVLGGALTNNALLDPPQLFSRGRGWKSNGSPTTSFRHAGAVVTARADGSASTTAFERDWLVHEAPAMLGSVGLDNGPHYVPDWQRWTTRGTR